MKEDRWDLLRIKQDARRNGIDAMRAFLQESFCGGVSL